MPNLKVPPFLEDLYYDLRERHLLPLVVLLVLAIIAVPIALSNDEASVPPGLGLAEGGLATPSEAEEEGKIVVAKSAPGLRDYQRRLKHRTPRDPFKQKFTGPTEAGSTPEEGGSGDSSAEAESQPPPIDDTLTPPSGGDESPDPDDLTYFSYAIDVRVVPVSSGGKKSKAKPSVRRRLPNLTMLPSRESPAVTYMGVTRDAKKAVMLISSDVTGAFGDGVCVAGGSKTCQLMALEPGIPETFVYGGKRLTFRIEVLKIQLLETDRLNTAPLGDPKKKQKQAGLKAGRPRADHRPGQPR
ncbi:MAG: hypothetical protein WD827_05805 [Solirubrobacterales bacterium]